MRLVLFFLVWGNLSEELFFSGAGGGGGVIQYTLGPNLCDKKNSEYPPLPPPPPPLPLGKVHVESSQRLF